MTLTVDLSLNGNPLQLPTGTWVEWVWGDGTPPGNMSLSAPASTATSDPHQYAPGSYTPTVTFLLPGSISCGPYTLPEVDVAACVPCPTSVVVSQDGPVTGCAPGGNPAVTLQASLTWPANGGPFPTPTGYNWEVTTPAPSRASYSKSTPYQGGAPDITDMTAGWTTGGGLPGAVDLSEPGDYSVSVTAIFGSGSGVDSDCPLQGSGIVTVPTCTACPAVSNLQATVTGCVGQGGNPSVAFQVTFSGATANAVNWTVTNPVGATATQTTPGTTTNSSNANGQWTGAGATSSDALDLSAAGSYTVSITANVSGAATACPPSAPIAFTVPQCPPPPSGGGGGGGSLNFGCAALLITALALLVIGGIVAEIGICFAIQVLAIAGAAAAAAGLVLFILWLIFCAAFTPCSVMRDAFCLLFWISQIVGAIQMALAGAALVLPNPSIWCLLTSVAAYAGWSGILLRYGQIMGKLNCPPRICFKITDHGGTPLRRTGHSIGRRVDLVRRQQAVFAARDHRHQAARRPRPAGRCKSSEACRSLRSPSAPCCSPGCMCAKRRRQARRFWRCSAR